MNYIRSMSLSMSSVALIGGVSPEVAMGLNLRLS
jgi:hypothetical protein